MAWHADCHDALYLISPGQKGGRVVDVVAVNGCDRVLDFCIHYRDILTLITHVDDNRRSKAFMRVCLCEIVCVCVCPDDKIKTAETTITKLAK